MKVNDGSSDVFTDGVAGPLFSHPADTCEESEDYNFFWDFDADGLGIYTISAAVSAAHQQSGDAEDEVTIEIIEVNGGGGEIEIGYPAAPAVAARLLKLAGVSPSYSSGTGRNRTNGNFISDVAQHMGPGTEFDGVEKTEVVEYCEAVADFLNNGDPSAGVDPANCAI